MGSAICRRCHNGPESSEHVFKECPIAKETWSTTIACALWVLWNTRNRFIHKGDLKSGSQTTAFIKNYIRELDGLSSSLPTMQVLISRWDAPTDPWVKINFDADFKKELKESCSGLVARNARQSMLGYFKGCEREANKVAHLIAKEGLQKKETTYLQNTLTSGVEEALNEDRRRVESLRD
ncbi:hypothetical protein GOBAR_AA03713 [Gossypium barbadense]|uniref:Reverse transcriptase zinc-binding domain-containing protein n=1 Tax=Gossypium barbadense TaxID=3634 RepID=A0A2P5YMT0_GOSBA|nr:hypothetical protein GOBAR_AA03713 [Gossypium barbadense]